MNAYDDNVQTGFLDNLKAKKTPVTVYVSNGFQMRGVIERFDKRVLILNESGKEKMVYHGAISTIEPHYADAKYGGGTP